MVGRLGLVPRRDAAEKASALLQVIYGMPLPCATSPLLRKSDTVVHLFSLNRIPSRQRRVPP